MLPNTSIDVSSLNRTDAREKTLTFALEEAVNPVVSNTMAILGTGVLGSILLNNDYVGYELGFIFNGKTDGLDALKQNIRLMLSIEADQYIIYPYTYGVSTLDLIGKPYYYVMAVLPDRIKETLMSDDRVTGVSDFEFNVQKNKLGVKFVVHSIYGEVEGKTEVTY